MTGGSMARRSGLGKEGDACPEHWRLEGLCARALPCGASDTANLSEGFEPAQWALQNDAADALSAMARGLLRAARSLASSCAKSRICSGRARPLIEAWMRRRARRTPRVRKRRAPPLVQIEARLAEKQDALRQAFPDYAELADAKPLALGGRTSAARRRGCPGVVSRSVISMGGFPRRRLSSRSPKKKPVGRAFAWAPSVARACDRFALRPRPLRLAGREPGREPG